MDRGERDLVSKFAQRLEELLGSAFFRLGIGFLALFNVVDAIVEYLPEQAAEAVCDGPDGSFIAEPWQ